MYYVTMTDRFMSEWGRARGKVNKLVICCETYDQAQIVADNAADREEMKHINITTTKPRYPAERYYVSWAGVGQEQQYETWFKPGAFRRGAR
jgi:uncharacterized protein YkwD